MNKPLGTVAYLGGIPALLEEFAWSWTQMIQWNAEYLCGPGEYVHYDRTRVSVHDAARNLLAATFRGDWLLQLDADHQFEPDLCARLLRVMGAAGADVVTGLYQYRQPPHSPVLYRHDGDGLRALGDWDRSLEAMEVDSAGAGCLLVRRRVFDRIRGELREEPFDRIAGYGEDHSFFLRLRRLEIRAVCALGVECHHLQVRALSLADYARDEVTLDAATPARGYR